jgi:hypothetical protein
VGYEYDIFISYRRNPETLAWIKEHFVPLLQLRVEFELHRCPSIFVDETEVESGSSWPAAVGAALGKSRMLIPLWSGNYLASVWCAEELSHMLSREAEAALRTAHRTCGLIVPAFIHDGESFPPDLLHIKHFAIQQCFNVRMARNSPRAEELDGALTAQASAIAASINSAPQWRKKWPVAAANTFFERFHRHAAVTQTQVPRFTRKK